MKTPYLSQDRKQDAAPAIPEWRELVTIVIERFWFGLAAAVLVFAFVAVRLMQTVPYYRSTAVIAVEPIQPRLLNYQDIVVSNLRNAEYFNTIIDTLQSQQMMEKALADSGLAARRDFMPSYTNLSAMASAALPLLSIRTRNKTQLIEIITEHPDPHIASDLANALARAYIQQDLDNRMTASMQAVEWLRARSEEYREKLEKGMLALQEYREEAQSVSLEEDQNIVIAKLKSLNASLTETQTKRMVAQSRWEAIQKKVEDLSDTDEPGNLEELQLVASELGNPELSAALSKLRGQQQDVARLRERYKSEHPDLREALQNEKQAKLEFQQQFDAAIYAIRRHYETVLANEQQLKQALRDQEQEAFALARELVRYNDIKRNVDADRNIYESIIARMKEASIAGTLPTERIRLSEDARPATRPSRPNHHRVLVRGAVVACVAGFGVIFLLYFTDHRFRRYDEIERAIGVPVLGSVPIISGASVRERAMVSQQHPEDDVAETFRTLRSLMEVNSVDKSAKILLVTSAHPGEGKSLVALNMAISHAQDNHRTLLIGADLRRPVLTKCFPDQRHSHGVSDAIERGMMWETLVQPSGIKNLDVLLSGSKKRRPAEVLGSQQFRVMLKKIREEYDQIIIDAPPVLGVSDTLALLKLTDEVLFVVRYGVTHSTGAIHAMKRIEAIDAACVGCVMNGVDLKSIANSYYYRQYGGYGYNQYIKAANGSKSDESEPSSKKSRWTQLIPRRIKDIRNAEET